MWHLLCLSSPQWQTSFDDVSILWSSTHKLHRLLKDWLAAKSGRKWTEFNSMREGVPQVFEYFVIIANANSFPVESRWWCRWKWAQTFYSRHLARPGRLCETPLTTDAGVCRLPVRCFRPPQVFNRRDFMLEGWRVHTALGEKPSLGDVLHRKTRS